MSGRSTRRRFGGPLGAIRRDHRKLLAVDGEYASTGGVCISDGWLVTSPETGLPYRDTAVGIRGPAVAEVERAFAGLWSVAGESLPEDESPTPRTSHRPAKRRRAWSSRNRAGCGPCACCSCSPQGSSAGSGSPTPTSSLWRSSPNP